MRCGGVSALLPALSVIRQKYSIGVPGGAPFSCMAHSCETLTVGAGSNWTGSEVRLEAPGAPKKSRASVMSPALLLASSVNSTRRGSSGWSIAFCVPLIGSWAWASGTLTSPAKTKTNMKRMLWSRPISHFLPVLQF